MGGGRRRPPRGARRRSPAGPSARERFVLAGDRRSTGRRQEGVGSAARAGRRTRPSIPDAGQPTSAARPRPRASRTSRRRPPRGRAASVPARARTGRGPPVRGGERVGQEEWVRPSIGRAASCPPRDEARHERAARGEAHLLPDDRAYRALERVPGTGDPEPGAPAHEGPEERVAPQGGADRGRVRREVEDAADSGGQGEERRGRRSRHAKPQLVAAAHGADGHGPRVDPPTPGSPGREGEVVEAPAVEREAEVTRRRPA
jgi:hypothetical protein